MPKGSFMRKPESLRKTLSESVAYIKGNPDQLHVFIKDGSIISTLAASLSFEYQYTLNIFITNYCGDANLLIVPILYWLKQHQPDILTSDKKDGFQFEVDIINNQQSDIDINLKLTERVIVKKQDDEFIINQVLEPNYPI